MPLPNNRTFNTTDLTAYTPSCGTTPVTAYARAPLRGKLLKVTGILGGAITTADGTITVNVVGGSAGVVTFTVTQSGSAAGQLFSGVPASSVYLNEDDVLSIVPSGASGANIPMHFSIAIKAA